MKIGKKNTSVNSNKTPECAMYNMLFVNGFNIYNPLCTERVSL